MPTLIPHAPSRHPARKCRRVRTLLEGLEVRQVPTSFLSPTSLVLLNPQPLPPGSSPTAVHYPPNPYIYVPPGPI
jgi:hypothetical protein